MTADAVTASLASPVRGGGNAFESTVERLARSIKLGLLSYGERLPPERELAESLQVGRTTLREALEALRQAGYVETRRGRAGGTFVVHDVATQAPEDARHVAKSMGAELSDALDFRRVVEPGAAALAATRSLSPKDQQRLRILLADVEQARDDVQRRAADSRLHLAVAQLSGSPSVLAAVTEVQLRVGRLLAAIPVLRRNIEHSDAQHSSMVGCVLAGDPEGARRAVEEHCDATSALLRGFLG